MKNKKDSFDGKLLSGRVYPDFLKLNNSDIVLNIGCGTGPQALSYKDNYEIMVGVDINIDRLITSLKKAKIHNIKKFHPVNGNVEKLPVKNDSFDKILAIDIIEHVKNPEILCNEIYRVLKKDGLLLITFPAMHDKFTSLVSKIARLLRLRKKREKSKGPWNPDDHNQDYPVQEWIKLVENSGFKIEKCRASTMFPPLHLYGIPRFWFKYNLIYKIDSKVCRMPFIKYFGQSLVCVFRHIPADN